MLSPPCVQEVLMDLALQRLLKVPADRKQTEKGLKLKQTCSDLVTKTLRREPSHNDDETKPQYVAENKDFR